MSEMRLYCCFEHIELAFEEVIEEYEQAPNFEKLEDKHKLSTRCVYCSNPADYLVTN
ncbi:CxxH/CxxC protein [Terrilactibacillus laevilacticus]|uniref:CxxH/CxxC protein n=1 Tax=Terrilactibacillus laevilacticus TaxID=1380157 RepID=A0ABW5PNU8_9BACI|nr:CxxH/CxxC protein [Terrilactibacillus laevilacticus]